MAKRKSNRTGSVVSLCILLLLAIYVAFFKDAHSNTPAKRPAAPREHPAKKPKAAPRALTVFSGKVIGIKDGDTFEVLYEGQPERVRLAEIDCPEKSQPFGNNAKQFASDLCFGQNVTVSSDGKRDRYGRIVGTVITEGGGNVNEALVKAGLAWHYKAYSESAALSEMELQARSRKIGLWADENPTPPWEWRKKKHKRKIYSRNAA